MAAQRAAEERPAKHEQKDDDQFIAFRAMPSVPTSWLKHEQYDKLPKISKAPSTDKS